MTIKKTQSDKTITEVVTAPVSLADALAAKKKSVDKLKNNQIMTCSKCGRAFKNRGGLATHEKSCKGEVTKGGAREGAGRPQGALSPTNLELKMARDHMQKMIASKTNTLLTAQLRMALGSSSLWMRWQEEVRIGQLKRGNADSGNEKVEKVWRSKKVTEDADYMIYLSLDHSPDGRAKDKDNGVEYYYMVESKGDHQAIVNLLDRAFGKPKESLELDTPPPEPLGEAGTGTTVVLRQRFVEMVKETIISKGNNNAA